MRTEEWVVWPPARLAVFDGLVRLECYGTTVDGKEYSPYISSTSLSLTLNNYRAQKITNIETISHLRGTYWEAESSLPRDTAFAIPTVNLLELYLYKKGDMGVIDGFTRLQFSQKEDEFRKQGFKVSFPAFESKAEPIPDRSYFSVQLDDLQIFDHHGGGRTAGFLSKWRDIGTPPNMLPLRNHVGFPEGAEVNPIEQFHAIKAAESVLKHRLKIVAGPGFTGGDLVDVSAGNEISYRLTNNENKWYAGKYFVRLWFYRSSISLHIKIFVQSDSNFVWSELEQTIPPAGSVDLNKPRYNDLISFSFAKPVILTAGMPFAHLTLLNMTSNASIIVDRIELLFAGGGASAVPDIGHAEISTCGV